MAPSTLALDGCAPGDGLWLRADPVHLRLYQDRVVLLDQAALALEAQEAAVLAADLERHFAADGMSWRAPHPERWYLRLDPGHPPPETEPLDTVAGRPVDAHLPRGASAHLWRRLLSEAQMLLHAHPVNEARQNRGAAPVNSVWFWGAGRHRPLKPPVRAVLAEHPLARALAAAAGVACNVPLSPASLDEHDTAMVVLELPAAVDPERLARELARLDGLWFRPLLDRLLRGRLAELHLQCPGPWGLGRRLKPLTAYRFWRRLKH